MRLNTLSPAPGRIKGKRCGRGIGSGLGRTCWSWLQKVKKSRSGGTVRQGFEGGQMPLQKRLPKYGFTSHASVITQRSDSQNSTLLKARL